MTPEASAPIYPTPNATPLTLEATFCDKAKREILRFGDAIRQANNGDERIGRRGPRNLLELLPDTFTVEDAVRVRQQQGLKAFNRDVSHMISIWKNREYVSQISDLSFQKLRFKSSQ